MKVQCKDCSYIEEKSEAIKRVVPDTNGCLVAECPNGCGNKVFFRQTGPKRVVHENSTLVHYK